MKSKNEPRTQTLNKLMEKLSAFWFSLGYVSGKSLLVTDYLSRNPAEVGYHPDRIVPITFCTASSDLIECLENENGMMV